MEERHPPGVYLREQPPGHALSGSSAEGAPGAAADQGKVGDGALGPRHFPNGTLNKQQRWRVHAVSLIWSPFLNYNGKNSLRHECFTFKTQTFGVCIFAWNFLNFV